jgi:hypothetical protein
VGWIKTTPNTTKMIDLKPRWDWSLGEFVGNAMDFVPFSSFNVNLSVSLVVHKQAPKPTARVWLRDRL